MSDKDKLALRVLAKVKHDAFASFKDPTYEIKIVVAVPIPTGEDEQTWTVGAGSQPEHVQALLDKLKKDKTIELITERGTTNVACIRIDRCDYASCRIYDH